MERWLLAKELGHIAPQSTIYYWAKLGLIPCVRMGRFVRFPEQAVKAWAESQVRPVAPTAA